MSEFPSSITVFFENKDSKLCLSLMSVVRFVATEQFVVINKDREVIFCSQVCLSQLSAYLKCALQKRASCWTALYISVVSDQTIFSVVCIIAYFTVLMRF